MLYARKHQLINAILDRRVHVCMYTYTVRMPMQRLPAAPAVQSGAADGAGSVFCCITLRLLAPRAARRGRVLGEFDKFPRHVGSAAQPV